MNTTTHDKSRGSKWIIYTLIGVAGVFVCATVLINLVGEPYLKDRLQSEFAGFSNQDATLEISDLDIGLFPISLEIEGASLSSGSNVADRMKNHPVLETNIESISISNMSWWSLVTSGDLLINKVAITGGDLHLTPGLFDRFSESNETSGESRTVRVNLLSLTGSSLIIHREDLSSVKSQITGADLRISGLNLSSGDVEMRDRFDHFSFEIDSVSHHTEAGYYRAKMSRLAFNSDTGNFSGDTLMVIPQYSPKELPKQIGHEVDHIEIHSGPVTLNDLDVAAWFEDRRVQAESITVDKPKVRISRDKNPPDKPLNIRPLLNAQFANLPFSVLIDTFTVRNGFISYREWKEEQDSSGTVFFDSVEIRMTDIQNSRPEQTIKAYASTLFMNESKLTIWFDFTLNDDGAQTIAGQMDSLDLRHLNPVLAPLSFVRIDDGVIHSMFFNFEMNETVASGEFLILYDNFSMSLLSDETLEKTTGNRIVSFLANTIQLKSSNLEPDSRTGKISFEKEEGQSTVNYWWKSLRSGMKDLVERL